MFKKHRIYYMLLLTALILTVSAFTTGYFVFSSSSSIPAQCAQLINEKLPENVEVLSYYDSHASFLADGETLAVLRLTDAQEREFIYHQGIYASWDLLNRSLNRKLFGEKAFTAFYDKIPFNEINRGYYVVNDRMTQRGKVSKIDGIFNRNAIHFSMGIYDMENNLLYVYALDVNQNVTPNFSKK